MSATSKRMVSVQNLRKYFPIHHGMILQRVVGNVKAVDDVSFDIFSGETLGLVGETGSGKTTIRRTVLCLYGPTAGKIFFEGTNLVDLSEGSLRKIRSRMQMIFHDPYASLNPRMTAGSILSAPLEMHSAWRRKEKSERVDQLLELVGLNPDFVNRCPHESSGGLGQRICIARVLALNPDLIVCDEPISSLDVSIQAQVVDLLEELQDRLSLTYLFIAHDLSMVRHFSSRMAVMYLAKIVGLAGQDEIYLQFLHPHIPALLSAVPMPGPDRARNRKRIIGDIPSPANLPVGCNFNTRCQYKQNIRMVEETVFCHIQEDHWVACHFAEKI